MEVAKTTLTKPLATMGTGQVEHRSAFLAANTQVVWDHFPGLKVHDYPRAKIPTLNRFFDLNSP